MAYIQATPLQLGYSAVDTNTNRNGQTPIPYNDRMSPSAVEAPSPLRSQSSPVPSLPRLQAHSPILPNNNNIHSPVQLSGKTLEMDQSSQYHGRSPSNRNNNTSPSYLQSSYYSKVDHKSETPTRTVTLQSSISSPLAVTRLEEFEDQINQFQQLKYSQKGLIEARDRDYVLSTNMVQDESALKRLKEVQLENELQEAELGMKVASNVVKQATESLARLEQSRNLERMLEIQKQKELNQRISDYKTRAHIMRQKEKESLLERQRRAQLMMEEIEAERRMLRDAEMMAGIAYLDNEAKLNEQARQMLEQEDHLLSELSVIRQRQDAMAKWESKHSPVLTHLNSGPCEYAETITRRRVTERYEYNEDSRAPSFHDPTLESVSKTPQVPDQQTNPSWVA